MANFLSPPTLPSLTDLPEGQSTGTIMFRSDFGELFFLTPNGWESAGIGGRGNIDGGRPNEDYGWLGLGVDGGNPTSELPSNSGVDAGSV